MPLRENMIWGVFLVFFKATRVRRMIKPTQNSALSTGRRGRPQAREDLCNVESYWSSEYDQPIGVFVTTFIRALSRCLRSCEE